MSSQATHERLGLNEDEYAQFIDRLGHAEQYTREALRTVREMRSILGDEDEDKNA